MTSPEHHQNQLETVKTLLRSRPAVCSSLFVKNYITRGASLIHRLKRRGWEIASRPCSDQDHAHQGRPAEYVLVSEPA